MCLVRLSYGQRLLRDTSRPPLLELQPGLFDRAELMSLGGGTDELPASDNPPTLSCTEAQEHSIREYTIEPIQNDRVINWADIDKIVEKTSHSLPPEVPTLSEAQIKDSNYTFKKQTTKHTKNSTSAKPKGKLVQGHLFWVPSKNSAGFRSWVISLAASLRHNVCVI